jgi:hypothetical protein
VLEAAAATSTDEPPVFVLASRPEPEAMASVEPEPMAPAELAAAESPSAETQPVESMSPEPQEAVGGLRVSSLEEVRDGGYGVGSAAPIDDGAQPLGHPIKGNLGSMTFHEPGSGGYDQTTAQVWFLDAETAERFGFTRAAD